MEVQTKKRSKSPNVDKLRQEFPMLGKKVNRKPFIYFDNAATSHKPQSVLQRLQQFYMGEYGKPKESHELGKMATESVEEARSKIANFIGAGSEKSIVFTRGCTESINIVAGGFAREILKKRDEILITALEHHANIIPWQMACAQSGAILKVVPITPSGEIEIESFENMLSDRTKIVAVSHSSHVFGTILPVKKMVTLAHKKGIPVLVDGAQTVPHMPVNVEDLDCDFYTFSAHKMGGPAGVGVLYGKRKWLNQLPPFEGGSDMAKKVSFEKTEYESVPQKFEAGTMPFADIIAFGAGIDFLEELGMENLFQYEQELLAYATEELSKISGVTLLGSAAEKEAVISFYMEQKDVKKLEKYLSDEHNIFVRAGELNAQPLMKVLGVKGLLRISFSYYNTMSEIDTFVKALKKFLEEKK